jgi:HlyD family secretion protein
MLEPQQHEPESPVPASPEAGALYAPPQTGGFPSLFGDLEEELSQTRKPWWRRNKWLSIGLGALAVLVVAAIVVAQLRGRNVPVTYTTGQARTGTLTLTVGATGPVQGKNYNLSFSASAPVAEIDVTVGQQVHSGDKLAKLDTTTLQSALDQARVQRDQAWANWQNQIFSCNNQTNPPPQCTTPSYTSYENALIAYNNALNNLNQATMYAPHDGVIVAVNGTVGSSPSSGSGSGSSSGSSSVASSSAFIVLTDVSALQVQASVNEADISGIATGQTATFTISAFANQTFRGTVSLISPNAQTTSNVVTYPVTIAVDMTALNGKTLLPGMTANITIQRLQRTGVTLVPAAAISYARSAAAANDGRISRTQARQAITDGRTMLTSYLQQHPESAADNPQIAFVLQHSGSTWTLKPVVIGLTDGAQTEVLAGLSAGDQMVIGQQGGSGATTSGAGTGTGGGLFGGGGRGAGGAGGAGGGRGGAGGGR